MNSAKLIGILILVIFLGIVFIQNLEPVQVNFLFITIEMPHILLLLLTAAGGFALGLFIALLNGPEGTKSINKEIRFYLIQNMSLRWF
mgnify:CR=1 FL=1